MFLVRHSITMAVALITMPTQHTVKFTIPSKYSMNLDMTDDDLELQLEAILDMRKIKQKLDSDIVYPIMLLSCQNKCKVLMWHLENLRDFFYYIAELL